MTKKQDTSADSKREAKSGSRRMSKTLLAMLCATVAILIIGVAAVWPFIATRADRTANVKIPAGATLEMVSDTLHKYFDPAYADIVTRFLKIHHRDMSDRHGLYEIQKGTMAVKAGRRLAQGAQTPQRLVINHYRTLESLSQAIANRLDFSEEDFRKALLDPATLKQYGLTQDQALSLILEDTYEVYWTTSPSDLIAKIGENYKRLWSPDNTRLAEKKGLTPAQLMTIASIADEETNKKDEKGRVGTLYANRLREGMRLQADPTVKYAIGNFMIKRVTREMLSTESPYNTYRVNGVPPGPIRTTSKATVEEILHHAPTDELYMCAKEDFSGYHNFAHDYATHTQNAMRYQQELNKRGIH